MFLFALVIYFGPPIIIFWGWVRWKIEKGRITWGATLSLLGFGLATLACFMAIGTAIYGAAVGGFPFYDRRLLRMYFLGAVCSLFGLILGLAGIWHRNPIRWHAPAASLGMLLFWLASATSE